jgi:DNA-binding IclR family transcriptional regulator
MTQLLLPLAEKHEVRVRDPASGETAVGRTVRDIARAIRRPPSEAQRLLDELAEAGFAVEVAVGVWRLTETAERRYGHAFRELPSWLEAGSV